MNNVYVCICITAIPKYPTVNVDKSVFFDRDDADKWINDKYREFVKNNPLVFNRILQLLRKPLNTELNDIMDSDIIYGVNTWLKSKHILEYWHDSYIDIEPFQCDYTVYVFD